MTTNKNNNGIAVTVKENSNNELLTAVVASKPANGARKAVPLPSDKIEPSDYNARKTFDPEALQELSQSISVHGLIQPVTVRAKGEGERMRYEIICGERRFRACRLLNMKEIPCIIREATDEQARQLSVTENVQRVDVPPMEAAEEYRYQLEKGCDVASLAIIYGKSEKHIYQMLKLCDLIPGIARLVRERKLSASAGIVISKYDKKIQAEILDDRLGKDGTGDWCSISAGVLEGKIHTCYTNKLENYLFDKAACMKCAFNTSNFDLFAEGSGCGRCTNNKCLSDKQTAFLVDQAKAEALKDPKLTFINDSYGSASEAKQIIQKAGYEFKNVQTYNLVSYPKAPAAPQATDYKKPEDFEKAQARHDKDMKQYDKRVKKLQELKEQGKIRVYANITRDAVTLHYKEMATKDTKSNDQLITELTAKKKRNVEIQGEKTAEGLKELLRTESLPLSAFTADEETAMYFFMLSKLRRSHYPAVGLKENDYYVLTDEKKLEIAQALTEEQKTVIRRDYLYSHLTEHTTTVANAKGGILLAFARQHLPEKTEAVVNAQKEDYGKKNARVDERIAGLKKAEKKAKSEAKGKAEKQKAPKTAGAEAVAAKAGNKVQKQPTTTQKTGAVEVTSSIKTDTKAKEQVQTPPASGKVLIVSVPEAQSKPAIATGRPEAIPQAV